SPAQTILTKIQDGSATQNEIWTLDVNATGGTFTLTQGTTTDPIAFDATAADVQKALVELASIGVGANSIDNVSVTGVPGSYRITFVNEKANLNVTDLTTTFTGLTGSPSIVGSTTTNGVLNTTSEVQTVQVLNASGGNFILVHTDASGVSEMTAPLPYNA